MIKRLSGIIYDHEANTTMGSYKSDIISGSMIVDESQESGPLTESPRQFAAGYR